MTVGELMGILETYDTESKIRIIGEGGRDTFVDHTDSDDGVIVWITDSADDIEDDGVYADLPF